MIDVRCDSHGKVTVVLDSQAGSCGKGKFIGYLSQRDNIANAICNFMSNAGHTYVTNYGTKVVTQQLPTSIINEDTKIYIGPEAAITPGILFNEMHNYDSLLGNRKVYIDKNAVVIKNEHRIKEAEILRSGSTFKGCGAARADKVMRQAELFGSYFNNNHKSSTSLWRIEITDCGKAINDAIDNGESVIVEGSQGFDLDINFGLGYPHTTSRQCHAGQLVADCGISPRLVDDIIMIMRPYPIRISNTTNLKNEDGSELVVSSGDYSGSEEITWDEVKRRCGAPDDIEFGEITTVTKRMRRVFELNWDRLMYAVKVNRPTQIALNFAQYIDWGAYRCNDYGKLPEKVTDFIHRVEYTTGVPVTLIGTGERNCDIIDITNRKL